MQVCSQWRRPAPGGICGGEVREFFVSVSVVLGNELCGKVARIAASGGRPATAPVRLPAREQPWRRS